MMRSIAFLLCVLATAASAEARFLAPFDWDVKEELDPNNMKVVTINGATPGPTIRVQQGDTIVVKVTNHLEEELAIRWKIKQIRAQPCQGTNGFILARGTCAYRLVADQPGKFSYQSEFKMQGDAGLSGSIVVLPQFKKNP